MNKEIDSEKLLEGINKMPSGAAIVRLSDGGYGYIPSGTIAEGGYYAGRLCAGASSLDALFMSPFREGSSGPPIVRK